MPEPLRIIFMGTPQFAEVSLQALLDGPDEVVAVVTQPDRAKGRGKKMQEPPVKTLAKANDIPVLQPTADIRSEEFQNGIASYQPDLIVVAAYGRMLPKKLLELPPLGCINVHGSLLPKYRGAAPIQQSIINNDSEVGVTIMQMDEEMDTGDILCRSRILPDPGETSGSLFVKLAALGSGTLLRAIRGLKEGTLLPTPQDNSIATYAPMLKKEDGLINWQLDAENLESLIRGLDPWPTGYCFFNGKRLRLFKPEVVYLDPTTEPGTVIQADEAGLVIACGTNALKINEIQPEGKKRMKTIDWLRGANLAVGTSLQPEESAA